MRVIVATSFMPFVSGGASLFTDWLVLALRERGHEVEFLQLPFCSDYMEIPDQLLAMRLLDVSHRGDRLIAIRPPSYLLRHPNKVVWFIHHHRTAYDLWGTPYQDIPNTPEGESCRDMIRQADNLALGEARRIFTNSKIVGDRLRHFNAIDSTVLYPPLWKPERFTRGCARDYLLYMSRITGHKRQMLAIEALATTRSAVKLMIVGAPDPGPACYVRELRATVSRMNLDDRVVIIDRWVSETEKVKLFAECLGAVYMPFDEDSYGYPSLEAHHAGKPVITAKDAGGVLELVCDGYNGVVADPEPEAIGEAMDCLYMNRALAVNMGKAGVSRMRELGIDWDNVVSSLTQ